MGPVRLGIVGCGAVAEMAHIPAAQQVEDAHLVALIDTDLARANSLAARHAIPLVAAGVEDVAEEVDAVILATPPHVRCHIARQALERGLHVLCEKPMANTSDECRQMVEMARSAQRTLAVGHTYRFFPNRIRSRALIQGGELGSLISGKIEQGDPFSWPSHTFYTLKKDWVPGGVLFNEGIHLLDMLLWWFGTPSSFEYRDDSLGGLESNVQLSLSYADGSVVSFRLSRTSRLANRVELQFRQGAISFPVYDMGTLGLAMNGKLETLVLQEPTWDFVRAAAAQLRNFSLSILQGRPPAVTGEEGLAVVAFIEACYARSAERSRPARTPSPGLTW